MKAVDEKHLEELRNRLEKYLESKDFFFNPDPDTLDSILRAMTIRFEQFGEDYCPCRRVTGDKEKDKLIICPCVYHLDELATQGACHCRLFTRN